MRYQTRLTAPRRLKDLWTYKITLGTRKQPTVYRGRGETPQLARQAALAVIEATEEHAAGFADDRKLAELRGVSAELRKMNDSRVERSLKRGDDIPY